MLTVSDVLLQIPPPRLAALPESVLFVTVKVPELSIPPPSDAAELPESVLFVTVSVL